MMDTMDGIKPQITSHTDALNSILIYDEAVGLSSLSSVSLITTRIQNKTWVGVAEAARCCVGFTGVLLTCHQLLVYNNNNTSSVLSTVSESD